MQKQHSTNIRPTQVWPENYKRGPANHSRTMRPDQVSVVTSSFAGKLVPLKMIPLLREDGIRNSRLSINLQMAETADMLLNPVRVSAMAYLVPKLAFERFTDMGSVDRSYNGQPEIDASVIPWFDNYVVPSIPPGQTPDPGILKTLGLHAPVGATVNADYIEAYNAVWNYIAMQRSSSLTARDRMDTTLAPAFWEHTQMRHVVPTFDAAMIEGEIPISFTSGGQLAVSGIAVGQDATAVVPNQQGFWSDGDGTNQTKPWGRSDQYVKMETDAAGLPQVFAELTEGSVKISLANIEQARETRAWAQMRNQYQGMSEDWMIDQLVAGIRLNDETLKQPILMDHSDTIVGMNERYATDGANLEKSVADGRTALQLNIRAPALQTGGIVVVCAQVLPEMVYER